MYTVNPDYFFSHDSSGLGSRPLAAVWRYIDDTEHTITNDPGKDPLTPRLERLFSGVRRLICCSSI